MTEVAFHFHVPDRVAYTCRLLRKAVGAGAQVAVTAPVATLAELDQALWTFSARDFIAHCAVTAPPAMRQASPVVLGNDPAAWPHHEVLVNLGDAVPEGFERFARLIEIVPDQGDSLPAARERWRHYQSRGYRIVRHDAAGGGDAASA